MLCVMWVVCGVFLVLCVFCYVELGVIIFEFGGEYIYIKWVFGDFFVFLVMWINFIIICLVCVVVFCLIFVIYIFCLFFLDCDFLVISIRFIVVLVIGEVFLIIFIIWFKKRINMLFWYCLVFCIYILGGLFFLFYICVSNMICKII